MPGFLVFKRIGLTLSAAFAMLYVALISASLLLVDVLKAGSWQAGLLGIEWRTVIGFEMGLVAVVIFGFAVSTIAVLGYRILGVRPRSEQVTSQEGRPLLRSGSFRVLLACFVLPPLLLIAVQLAVAGEAPLPTEVSTPVNLGRPIDSTYREAEPSFTADGRTMYFNCYNSDICVSQLTGSWEEDTWSKPKRLAAPINTEYEEVEPIINATGDELYFTARRPPGILRDVPFLSPFLTFIELVNRLVVRTGREPLLGGVGLSDIYVSHLVDGVWSQPANMNAVPGMPHVNTEFEDHCLFFSADGNQAFWSSTRLGGFGADDIWTSRRQGGQWTDATNLGPNVNGPGSEHTSIPTPDGRSLYVTSDRPGGLGGDDIYITTWEGDGTWGPMVNLGPMVNGPGDDRCPAWTPDLKIFLFDSTRESGRGGRDIWWVYFKDVRGYPPATAHGSTGTAPP